MGFKFLRKSAKTGKITNGKHLVEKRKVELLSDGESHRPTSLHEYLIKCIRSFSANDLADTAAHKSADGKRRHSVQVGVCPRLSIEGLKSESDEEMNGEKRLMVGVETGAVRGHQTGRPDGHSPSLTVTPPLTTEGSSSRNSEWSFIAGDGIRGFRLQQRNEGSVRREEEEEEEEDVELDGLPETRPKRLLKPPSPPPSLPPTETKTIVLKSPHQRSASGRKLRTPIFKEDFLEPPLTHSSSEMAFEPLADHCFLAAAAGYQIQV